MQNLNKLESQERFYINPQKQESQSPQQKQSKMHNRNEVQMLRIKVNQKGLMIQTIWSYDENNLVQFFQQYEVIPYSKLDTGDLFKMDRVKMIKNQNKVYFGQIEHKKKHGVGISISKDGKIYEGQFYQGEKQGYGCEIYSNGNLYIGNFRQNKKHGKGSFYWFSLSQQGQTKDLLKAYVQQYHGDWWAGLPDGAGQHQKNNGDYYVGKFKNGLKHGQGHQQYSNGDSYKGQFINGLPQGYGQYIWEDNSCYKGDFKQGYRNGYGVWNSIPGSEQNYKGHYMLDKKHGYGIYDWGNGYIYKGSFIEDLRSGEGQLYFEQELIYSGFWQNGQKVDNDTARDEHHQTSVGSYKNDLEIQHSTSVCVFPQKPLKKRREHQQNETHVDNNYEVTFKIQQPPQSAHFRNCYACQMKYQQKLKTQQKGMKRSRQKSKSRFQSREKDKTGKSLSKFPPKC